MKSNRDEPEYARRRHSHRELSLGIIDRGSTDIRVRELDFHLSPGDGIVIPPGFIHLCQPEEDRLFRFRMLYFEASWFSRAYSCPPGTLRPAAGELSPAGTEDLDVLCRMITRPDGPGAADLETESFAITLLGELLESLGAFPHPLPGDLPPDRPVRGNLKELRDRMEEEFDREHSLDDLAEQAGMNKYTFLRAFKRQFRLSPHAWLINCRINKTRQWLKEGRSMAAIAADAGFTDQSHFIRTFRRYVGVSPGEYRKG